MTLASMRSGKTTMMVRLVIVAVRFKLMVAYVFGSKCSGSDEMEMTIINIKL